MFPIVWRHAMVCFIQPSGRWKISNNGLVHWQAECLHTAPHCNHINGDLFMSTQSQMLIDMSLALLVSYCSETCHGFLYTTTWKSRNNGLVQWQVLHNAPRGNHTGGNFFMSIQSQTLIHNSLALLVPNCVRHAIVCCIQPSGRVTIAWCTGK